MTEKRGLPTVRDILYVFFKNKVLISSIFLTALVAAMVYCYLAPPAYRAETKLLVRIGKAQVSGIEQYRPESYNILFQERSQNIRNEIELIRGQYLTEKVLKRLHEQQGLLLEVEGVHSGQKSVLQFMDALRVELLEESDMIKLSFDWQDPDFAALVVNTYADEYLEHHAKVHGSERSHKFYVEQIETYGNKLKEAEDELQAFLNQTGIANLALQKDLLLRNITEYENKYQQEAVYYNETLTKLNRVKEMIQTNAWIETPDMGSKQVDKLAYLQTLDEAYFKLKVERERLLKTFTPKADEVQSIDQQTSSLRKQKAESLLNLLKLDLATTETKKESLHRELSALKDDMERLNSLTLRLRQLERAKEIIEVNYQLYLKKGEDLRIADDLDARKLTSVKIAAPALPPLSPAYPRKDLIIGISAFLGLLFGFAFCAAREYFSHTFKDDESVSAILGIPLLVSVPNMKQPSKRSGVNS